ncbi:MAG: 23S rRNA (pseudouridine(1915)-N(3))-methyltransferase RlmH [Acidobacteria bacterium]|nr:23S rRNA (pseudouridine(1915)-N(3))-methyltransferase RlmH [Acidobacteriota bacterium]
MRIVLMWVGKTRDRRLAALVDEYLERARRMARIEVVTLRDRGGAATSKGEPLVLEREADAMLESLEDGDFVVLCDETGTQLRSVDFAGIISERQTRSTRRMVFVIGGYLGVSARIRERADQSLALSRMTFTHEMARVLLAEQLYRALTILSGSPYQK